MYIGSAIGAGGLRATIARRIANPERYRSPGRENAGARPGRLAQRGDVGGTAERTERSQPQGGVDQGARSAPRLQAVLPGNAPATRSMGRSRERRALCGWSGFHAMHTACLPNIPTACGVFLIAAVCEAIPVMTLDGEEHWVNIRRDANRVPSIGPHPRKTPTSIEEWKDEVRQLLRPVAEGFRAKLLQEREGKRPTHDQNGIPIIYGHESDHDWLRARFGDYGPRLAPRGSRAVDIHWRGRQLTQSPIRKDRARD